MFKTKKVFALITALTMASALGAGAAADAAVIAPEDANVISAADAGMAFAAQYNLGDNVEDFDITLSDGTETSLYKLLAEKKAVMLNFWASWCGPCKMLAPTVDKLAEKYDGKVIVGKVDVDEEQELARQFGVMSIPTVVLFKDGKEVQRTVGVQPLAAFERLVDDIL